MLINNYKTAYLTAIEGEDSGFYFSQELMVLGWPFLPDSWNAQELKQYAYETRADDISGLYTRWEPAPDFSTETTYRAVFTSKKIKDEEDGTYWAKVDSNKFEADSALLLCAKQASIVSLTLIYFL